MNILSPDQIVALAAGAGFSGPDLATAAAIALAETLPSGNADSYNPEQRAGAAANQGSYGLWQIYITAHPEFNAAQLLDPTTNAAAAFQIYQQAGSSFRPWSTYASGKYLNYMPQVQAAIAAAAPSSPAPGDAGGNGGSAPPDGSSSGSSWPVIITAGALGLAAWFWLRG